MKISDKELNTIQDLIILIKMDHNDAWEDRTQNYIYDLIELLNLDASVIDGKTRRTEHALTLDTELRGPKHALSFINDLDAIWSAE